MAISQRDLRAMGKTAQSLVDFGKAVQKLKFGTTADANIHLNREECRALIWGLQLLHTRETRDGEQ